jgi:phage terminase large subunit-like protein
VALGTNRLTRRASTSEYIAIGFKPDSVGKSRILIYDFINSKVYREILFHTKGEEEIKAMEITRESNDWYLYVETITWNNTLTPNPVHGELIKFRISTGTVVWAKEIRSSLIGSGVISNTQNNKMAVFPSDDIIVVSYVVRQSASSTNSYMVTIAFDLNGNKKYDYVVKSNSTVSNFSLNCFSLGADYIWYNGGRIVSGFIDAIESSSQNEYIILEKENNNIISEGPVPNKPLLETYSDEMTVTNATVTITINTTNTSYLVSNIDYIVSNYNPNLANYGSSFVKSTIDHV